MVSRKERSKYGRAVAAGTADRKVRKTRKLSERERKRMAQAAATRRRRATAAGLLVGVDCGKYGHALCCRNPDLEDSEPIAFEANRRGFDEAVAEIRRHAAGVPPGDVLVGLEFAGVYGWTFAHYLRGLGYQVVNVLPRTTKSLTPGVHGSRLKTDKADARVIVDAVSQGKFNEHAFADPRYAELRYLSSGLRRLSKLRGGAVNRIRSVLQPIWPEFEQAFETEKSSTSFTQKVTPLAVLQAYPTPADFLEAPEGDALAHIDKVSRGQKGRVLYDRLRVGAEGTVAIPGASGALAAQARQLVAEVRFLDAQVKTLEELMERALEGLPEWPALKTLDGCGVATAGLFLGAFGDVRAYESFRQLLKLSGLNLITRESGETTDRIPMRISKQGRSEVRKATYFLALTLVRRGQPFHDAYQAMLKRNGGRRKMALVAVSRDALKLMFALAYERRPFTEAPPRRPGGRRGRAPAARA